MVLDDSLRKAITRRYFFRECGVGVGAIAHGLVESPSIRWRDRLFPRHRLHAVAAGGQGN